MTKKRAQKNITGGERDPAPPFRGVQPVTQFYLCPICRKAFPEANLASHMKSDHPEREMEKSGQTHQEPPPSPTTAEPRSLPRPSGPTQETKEKQPCPHCRLAIHPDFLEEHIKVAHPNSKVAPSYNPARPPKHGITYTVDESGFVLSIKRDRSSKNKIPRMKKSKQSEHVFLVSKSSPAAAPASGVGAGIPEDQILSIRFRGSAYLKVEPVKSFALDQPPCPICSEPVSSAVWGPHRRNVHIKAPFWVYEQQEVYCDLCGKKLYLKVLRQHLKAFHPDQSAAGLDLVKKADILTSNQKKTALLEAPQSTPNQKNQPTKKQKPKKSRGQLIDDHFNHVNSKALLEDSDDALEGGKGLGHMRREYGSQFGSYPLHDDYSEEGES